MGLGLGSGPRCVPGWRNAPIMSYPPPPFTPNPHQGTGDEICPEIFAKQLVAGLEDARVPHTAYFFDAGHSAKSDGMSKMLRKCVDEFVAGGPMASERE